MELRGCPEIARIDVRRLLEKLPRFFKISAQQRPTSGLN
jgi:hypothetical protein